MVLAAGFSVLQHAGRTALRRSGILIFDRRWLVVFSFVVFANVVEVVEDQEKALKQVRLGVEGWRGLVHTHEAQTVLKRLDLAFAAFFRRLKAGQAPGFPRFKSADRFRGWGYKEHGNGFRLEPGEGWRHGHVSLFGIGRMRLRGVARTPGRVLKADVLRDARGWKLSVVVETARAARTPAVGPAVGIDWGVLAFATLAAEDGSFETIANPRHLDVEAEEIRAAQRALSAKARARKTSKAALRGQRKTLARRHMKVAARRKEFLHQTTAALVRRHRAFYVEGLVVRNMTASARGTMEEPGRNVAQKAGLNRAILDTAPATFLNMLRIKAEEAGSEFLAANVKRLKPSQVCPDCGVLARKSLSLRRHVCACGCDMDRDDASALVLLRWGLAESARRREARAEADATASASRDSHPAGTVGVKARKCAA